MCNAVSHKRPQCHVQQVAEELDMHYVPGASLDAKYITNYGFDLRTVNDRMPPTMRTWDISQFLQNPRHRDSTCMQYDLFNIRFEQYIEAINHLLNTGNYYLSIRQFDYLYYIQLIFWFSY